VVLRMGSGQKYAHRKSADAFIGVEKMKSFVT
jgi:hypothetical protein